MISLAQCKHLRVINAELRPYHLPILMVQRYQMNTSLSIPDPCRAVCRGGNYSLSIRAIISTQNFVLVLQSKDGRPPAYIPNFRGPVPTGGKDLLAIRAEPAS